MNVARVETRVKADGELHRTELPCRRGDKIEAIAHILEQLFRPVTDAGREKVRAAGVHQFLARAGSSFRSASPDPTRDELQERQ